MWVLCDAINYCFHRGVSALQIVYFRERFIKSYIYKHHYNIFDDRSCNKLYYFHDFYFHTVGNLNRNLFMNCALLLRLMLSTGMGIKYMI